jgi:hypothetical protein
LGMAGISRLVEEEFLYNGNSRLCVPEHEQDTVRLTSGAGCARSQAAGILSSRYSFTILSAIGVLVPRDGKYLDRRVSEGPERSVQCLLVVDELTHPRRGRSVGGSRGSSHREPGYIPRLPAFARRC